MKIERLNRAAMRPRAMPARHGAFLLVATSLLASCGPRRPPAVPRSAVDRAAPRTARARARTDEEIAAEREEQRLAAIRARPIGHERPARELEAMLAESLVTAEGVFVAEPPRQATSEQLDAGIDVTVRAGRCRLFVLRGPLTELARHGDLRVSLVREGAEPVDRYVERFEGGLFVPDLCADWEGPARLVFSGEGARGSEITTESLEVLAFERPERPAATREELEAVIAARSRGFETRPLARTRGDLASPSDPLEVTLRYDECVLVVLRLGDGARLDTSNGPFLGMLGELRDHHPGPGRLGPGAIYDIGCSLERGRFSLELTELAGQGGYELTVLRRRLAPAELADATGWEAAELASSASYERARAERVRTACTGCDRAWRVCLDGDEGDCNAARDSCLSSWNLSDVACR